jgi:metal-sulfur cluster biosynthetic enzyme
MVTEAAVRDALREVHDPEIPVNIVDLGLVYEITIDGGRVFVDMTLTSMGCPIAGQIMQNVENAVLSVEGVEEADVELVWSPPWSPEMASEEGQGQLRAMGVSV